MRGVFGYIPTWRRRRQTKRTGCVIQVGVWLCITYVWVCNFDSLVLLVMGSLLDRYITRRHAIMNRYLFGMRESPSFIDPLYPSDSSNIRLLGTHCTNTP